MKIIKQGKIPELEEYKLTCRNCKCQFEFQRHEAKYVSDQRDGDFLQIACPCCHQLLTTSV